MILSLQSRCLRGSCSSPIIDRGQNPRPSPQFAGAGSYPLLLNAQRGDFIARVRSDPLAMSYIAAPPLLEWI
jgi:hypothetical protein